MQFKEFKQNVLNWSKERKIIPHSTSAAQMGKTIEEVAELWQALVKRDEKEIKDAIGDIAVTIVNVDALLSKEDYPGYASFLDDDINVMLSGYDWQDEMLVLLSQLSQYKLDPFMLNKCLCTLYSIADCDGVKVCFWECLEQAWNEIKDRKGTMGEDGVFIKMQVMYKVFGQNEQGRWLVIRADGLMCSGTWTTKEDAQKDCDKWNNRKSSWDIN